MADDLAPREVELKLRVDPAHLGRLRDCALIREHARGAMQTRQLVSTYFDTPDRRLAERGIALRLRRDGRRTVQTLKAAPETGGAVQDRREWETEVIGTTPELAAFEDLRVFELVGVLLPDELAPLFETRVRRQTVLVEWFDGRGPMSVVEVAFDEGTIEVGSKKEQLCEVELELKEGSAASLFALAAAMRETAPLAIETVDKAHRGYRLAADLVPAPRKAGNLAFAPDASVEDGLLAIFRHGFAHWLANEAPARDGKDPEGVHQLRVALRRLRSALSLVKGVLAESVAQRWNEEFRWLLGRMGAARDLDVLLTSRLPKLEQQSELASLVRPLRVRAEQCRAEAYDEVRATLASPRYADLALGFTAWVERHGWREGVDVDILLAQRGPLADLATATLAKRHRQVRKRGRHFETLEPEARHRLRIALKKLRYGTEYFSSLFEGDRMRDFARRLEDLQDDLGHLNDVAVGRELVLRLAGGMAPETRAEGMLGAGTLIGWQAAGLGETEPALIASWHAFRKEKPFWEVRQG